MKIIVCIAKTPDTTTKIAFKDNNTKFKDDGVQFIINPMDEYALTRALEIKEAADKGSVTVINVGQADTEPVIRKALAIGADDAIRIDAEPKDCYFVAAQITHYLKNMEYDFVLTGRTTSDYEGGQVGGMIAELLDMPFIQGVSKIDISNNEAAMEREIVGGKELLTVKAPFIAGLQEGVAEPRIPTMRGIMSARTKPLKVEKAIDTEPLTNFKNFELPPPKGKCKMIDAENSEELINLLHTEAKAI